jgi:hypothetical protein
MVKWFTYPQPGWYYSPSFASPDDLPRGPFPTEKSAKEFLNAVEEEYKNERKYSPLSV